MKSMLRAAYKLPRAEEGMARMEKLAQWLERDYPEAARSLREGLAETFTINRLRLAHTAPVAKRPAQDPPCGDFSPPRCYHRTQGMQQPSDQILHLRRKSMS